MTSMLPRRSLHLLLFLLAAPACAQTAAPPQSVIERYTEAVSAHDHGVVWELLDEDARLGLDEEEFAAFFEANYDLIREQADALSKGGQDVDAHIDAQVDLADHRVASLTWQDDRWFLTEAVPTGSGQQTPRDTLAAFVIALDGKDLDSLLTLMSHNRRGALVGEFKALRQGIVSSLDGGLVTRGDRAVLKLDNGDKVVLVREEGQWRIEGFERAQQ